MVQRGNMWRIQTAGIKSGCARQAVNIRGRGLLYCSANNVRVAGLTYANGSGPARRPNHSHCLLAYTTLP